MSNLNVNEFTPYHVGIDNLTLAAFRCPFEKPKEDTKHAHHAPTGEVGNDIKGKGRFFL